MESPTAFLEPNEPNIFDQLNWIDKGTGDDLLVNILNQPKEEEDLTETKDELHTSMESPAAYREPTEPDIFEQLNWIDKGTGDQLLVSMLSNPTATRQLKEEEEWKEPSESRSNKRRKVEEVEQPNNYEETPIKYSKQEENETEQKPFTLEDLYQLQDLPTGIELPLPPMDSHYPLFFGAVGAAPTMFAAWCFLNFGYYMFKTKRKEGIMESEQLMDLFQLEEIFWMNKALNPPA